MGIIRSRVDVPVTVYALTAAGVPEMYIGATSGPVYYRKATHITEAFLHRQKRKPINDWVRAIVVSGRDLELHPLEVIPPGEDWGESERFHVAYFRFLGCTLMNTTQGGMGTAGTRVSEDTRRRISKSHKALGLTVSPEHLAKMNSAAAAWRVAHPEFTLSSEARAKISAAQKGRKHSPEQLAKQSAAMREFHRKKREAAVKGESDGLH